MSILDNIVVYDVECYPNLFMVGFKFLQNSKYITLNIYPDGDIDDRKKIVAAFTNTNSKSRYFTGFNNLNYDDALINYIIDNHQSNEPLLTTHDLYELSKQLIGVVTEIEDEDGEIIEVNTPSIRNQYRFKSAFKSIDMLEVLRKGFNVKSLKAIAVNLQHEKIQDLPINPHVSVTEEQFQQLSTYNRNDLDITEKIVRREVGKLELRQTIEQSYNNEIDIIGDSDSGIAKKILTRYYKEGLAANGKSTYIEKGGTDRGDLLLVKDLVYDRISFTHPELISFFNHVLEGKIIRTSSGQFSDKYEWKDQNLVEAAVPGKKKDTSIKLKFGGNIYKLGLGGIHTKDEPAVYRSTDDMMILDIDVASMYPMSFIKNELYPEHLDKTVFLQVLVRTVDERLEYKELYKVTKQNKHKALQGTLKITVNTFYGLTNSKTCWLFDPKASFTCTVNNQLLMLMLIEQFEKYGHQVISANTDGVTLYIKRDKLEDVRRIYQQWEEMSYFALEEAVYTNYVRRDVNNYFAVVDNKEKEIKYKGAFEPQDKKDLLKAFKHPITTTALVNYFLHGIPVEQTIRGCDNIYDFCLSQKCSKQFTNYLHRVRRKYKVRHGKSLEYNYRNPIAEDVVLEELEQQRTLRFFVSNADVDFVDETDLANGYDRVVHEGWCVRKRKLRETLRYEAQTIGGLFFVVDLKTNETVGNNFRLKKQAKEVCDALNSLDDSTIMVDQTSDYVAGYFVTMFNDYYEVDKFADYDIDYDYYINVVNKEIAKIEGN